MFEVIRIFLRLQTETFPITLTTGELPDVLVYPINHLIDKPPRHPLGIPIVNIRLLFYSYPEHLSNICNILLYLGLLVVL